MQLIRYETRDNFGPDNDTTITYNKDPIITVNDYNIGVTYKLNANTASCIYEPISAASIDFDKNFTQNLIDSGNGYAIRMRSAKSLLQLDADYIFTGQRTVNGIFSDVFITKAKIGKMDFVTEYAFPAVFKNNICTLN